LTIAQSYQKRLASLKITTMNKRIITIFFISILLFNSNVKSFAWGKTGHNLVAEVAFKFLDSTTQKIVKKY
jgi:hypothetical protein